jgi:hypothetical protein
LRDAPGFRRRGGGQRRKQRANDDFLHFQLLTRVSAGQT